MNKFEEKKFNIPALKGISAKTIEEHVKLYAGYVKNANVVMEKISTLRVSFSVKVSTTLMSSVNFSGVLVSNTTECATMKFISIPFLAGRKRLTGNCPRKEICRDDVDPSIFFSLGLKNLALTRGIGWAYFGTTKKTTD